MIGAGDMRVADDIDEQRREIHLFAVHRPALIQPSQQQQVVDQPAHPGGLGLDPFHGVRDIRRQLVAGTTGQLGVPANCGQRRPQFVTGVGNELTYLALALLPCGQRVGHMAEHAIERSTNLPDLGVRLGCRSSGTRTASATSPLSSGNSATRLAVAATRRSGRNVSRTMSSPSSAASSNPTMATIVITADKPIDGRIDVVHRQAQW